MILGIGTDIVQVVRIQGSLDRFGDAFAQRILSTTELEEFRESQRPAHFLAKRFAAKEALVKAMGTGFRDSVKLSDIGVVHNQAGKPDLCCGGRAGELLREMGVVETHISLADERDYAIAFVILLTGSDKGLA